MAPADQRQRVHVLAAAAPDRSECHATGVMRPVRARVHARRQVTADRGIAARIAQARARGNLAGSILRPLNVPHARAREFRYASPACARTYARDKPSPVSCISGAVRAPARGVMSDIARIRMRTRGNFRRHRARTRGVSAPSTRVHARRRRISGVHKKKPGPVRTVAIPIFSVSIKRGCGALSFRYFFRHRACTRGPAAGAEVKRHA